MPETPSQILQHEQRGLCYCGCDKPMGQARCMKMCELPKYEDQSWATSCRKLTLTPLPPFLPAPASPTYHTSRHYRYLKAQIQIPSTPGTPQSR